MRKIIQRLHEMPYSMLLRVARKFKFNLTLDSPREKIIVQLEEIIENYLLDQENYKNLDIKLAKYNILADFEVPHEYTQTNEDWFVFSFTTFIDNILIDNHWSYIYWELSQNDVANFQSKFLYNALYLKILYNKNGFKKDALEFDASETVEVNIHDIEQNYYHTIDNTYFCTQLIATNQNGLQHLLAISRDIYLPHVTPSWKRHTMSEKKYLCLQYSMNTMESDAVEYFAGDLDNLSEDNAVNTHE